MEPEPRNLDERVAALDDLRQFRQATIGSFNALRADFVDLQTHVDHGFTEMRGKLDGAAAGQQQIIELIQGIVSDQGE